MRRPGELTEAQKRRLHVTCAYIDRLLRDVEEVLRESSSASPFPRHVADVTAAQTRALEEHIGRLRAQLLRTLAWQQMAPDPPEIPASRAVLTDLSFIDIAIEELKPGYMRGSGAVPEDAVDGLNATIRELRSAAREMELFLRRELGATGARPTAVQDERKER